MEFLTEEEREQFEVFHYTESEKNKLRSFDYFKKTDLYCREKEKNSILVCGKQQKETPFVSIILTTYKRPKLMIEAINSIIEQKDFTDYEIIICDNEGVALEIETETQKAVKELNNSHILYYRNVVTVTNNFDRGVSLASGEWICFLHDDDILDKKYLKTMTTIVKRYPEIDWLSCGTKGFTDMLLSLIHI